jgi:hypothetical protein
MLRVCRKGEVEGGQTLSAEEGRALRQAFGRFATPAARPAGAVVVRRYQHLGFGNWFLCDCLGPGRHPPALVPVLESFVRRHTDPPWPRHADECDFRRDPPEQRAITRSYARRGDPCDYCGVCRTTTRPASRLRLCRGSIGTEGRRSLPCCCGSWRRPASITSRLTEQYRIWASSTGV